MSRIEYYLYLRRQGFAAVEAFQYIRNFPVDGRF